jgi:hypothetical protein
MIERISQSFMKDYRAYSAGDECGNLIVAKYMDGRLLENEEPGSMELGSYLEFLTTGAIPKNGKVPVPQYMPSAVKAKKGVNLTIDDMTSEYRKAHSTADLLKKMFADMGLKIVAFGKKITKGRFEGTLDIVAEVIEVKKGFTWNVGDRIVIDMKYSGLVGANSDKRNKHGWQWSNIQKEYHGTQAVQYHFLAELPFYFWVTQSTQKEGDQPIIKLFHVTVEDWMIEKHINEGNALFSKFQFDSKIGFVPRPEYNRCNKCPLKEECRDRHYYPRPEVVDLTIE